MSIGCAGCFYPGGEGSCRMCKDGVEADVVVGQFQVSSTCH